MRVANAKNKGVGRGDIDIVGSSVGPRSHHRASPHTQTRRVVVVVSQPHLLHEKDSRSAGYEGSRLVKWDSGLKHDTNDESKDAEVRGGWEGEVRVSFPLEGGRGGAGVSIRVTNDYRYSPRYDRYSIIS